MSFKKFKGFSPETYKIISGILLAVAIIETLFLVRGYFKEHTAKAPAQINVGVQQKPIAQRPPTPGLPIPQVRPEPVAPQQSRGKIAIIVDDSGYNLRDCQYLRDIRAPVTISILPDLKHSTEIAQCAHNYKKEVMLHLPLEPHDNSDEYPKDYIINTEMPKGLIIERFKESLKSVPHVDGINNHMGSKATENNRLMSIIFDELNQRSLFFVDSRVTAKTICKQLAREKRLPFGQRDVFLDNVNQRPEIEKQFAELAEVAEKDGFAIGIGHARKLSWEIIKEQTEQLIQQGFEVVTVKEIIFGD